MTKKFILVNKPSDWTSHDVVGYIRNKIRSENIQDKKIKVGHAGTLDPFATGLLIIGVGRESTKQLDKFKNLPKTYITTIKLGATSDTFDKTGNIVNTEAFPKTKSDLISVLRTFLGKQTQVPPMFSAKKINGKRLYELARKGIEIERKPCEIEIYDIRVLDYSWPFLKIEVKCSTGTYIRSLAHDIGQKLETGGYCDELTRTKIGDYSIKEALNINEL